MKTFYKIFIISLLSISTFAQQASEIDAKSVKLPRYTNQTDINTALPTPTQGMMVYNIANTATQYYNGTAWVILSGGGGLTLPYSSTENSGANAFEINNTVGRAAYLQSPTSTETMRVYNSGTGNAALFEGTKALETMGNAKIGGNIDITGEIQTNGSAGTAGQFLRSNGNSTMSWANTIGFTMGYKKAKMILATGASTWTVPAGVTEIMVEIWSSGCYSNASAFTDAKGGNSGAYGRTIQTVIEGTTINFQIPNAGGPTGGPATVTFPSTNFLTVAGALIGDVRVSGTTNLDNAIIIHNNIGEKEHFEHGQKNANTWFTKKYVAKGAMPPGLLYTHSTTNQYLYYENDILITSYLNFTTGLLGYGGDGNGALQGGQGFAIIWWN